jgi:hypothetical protein
VQGRIPRGEDGLIDVAAADQAWPATTSPDHGGRRSGPVGRRPKRAKKRTKPARLSRLGAARLRRELAAAQLREMELHRLQGDVLDRATVERDLDEILRATRDAFITLADACAEDLSLAVLTALAELSIEESERRKIAALVRKRVSTWHALNERIREILADLADKLGRFGKPRGTRRGRA